MVCLACARWHELDKGTERDQETRKGESMAHMPRAALVASVDVVKEAETRNSEGPVSRRKTGCIQQRSCTVKDRAILPFDNPIRFGPIWGGSTMREAKHLGGRHKLRAIVGPKPLAFLGAEKVL